MKQALDSDPTLIELVRQLGDLKDRAVRQYRPLVDDMLRSGCRDVAAIERALDGLLDLCDHEPILAMFKALCRHYWHIDPGATAEYIQLYRKIWDSEEA